MTDISIAFVQRDKEIEFIFSKYKKNILFVPLNLNSQSYLELNNKKYINPINYIDKEFHSNSLKLTENFLSGIQYGNIKYQGLKTEFKSQIRFVLNSCIFLGELLDNLSDKFEIKNLIISGWHGKNYQKYKSSEIHMSSLILSKINKKFNYIYLSDDYKNINVPMNNSKYFFKEKNIKKESILLNNLGYNFIRIMFYKKLNMPVYLLNFSNNNIGFIKQIALKFLGLKILKANKIKSEKTGKLEIPNIKFIYKNYDFSDVVNIKKNELEYLLLDGENKISALDKINNKKNFKYYFSFSSRGVDGSIPEILNNDNTKSVNISHGTVSKAFDEHDLMYKKIISESVFSGRFNYFSIQTKICMESLKNTNKNIVSFIKTGNLIFANTKNTKSKKNILIATTLKNFHGLQFLGVEMFYEFFRNLKIFEEISKKKGFKFIINIHISQKECMEMLKKIFPDLVFTSKKIDNLIKNSFVTISYSSTSIEDSLVNKVPVILFDNWKRYKHCDATTNPQYSNAPIYYINTPKDLSTCLEVLKEKYNTINFEKVIYDSNLNKNFKNFFRSL